MKVRVRVVESVQAEVESVQRRVAERAAALFLDRGGAPGSAMEDWLKAERETVWRPPMEVVRTAGAFVVEAAVAGVNPRRLDVHVCQMELLLRCEGHHSDAERDGDVVLCEFVRGPLFRTYRFPHLIEPARVSAECVNGMLRVTAPIAHAGPRLAALVA